MATSPTQRTLKAFKDAGYTTGIVERYITIPNMKFGKRIDLFHIIDIIAMNGKEIIGVQSCGQAYSEHHKKIIETEASLEWLESGGILELWGWRKVKKVKGGKQMIWKPRVHRFTQSDFPMDLQFGKKQPI